MSPLLVRLVERNRIWVAVKNFPTWLLACGAAWSVWRTFWQVWGGMTRRGWAGLGVGRLWEIFRRFGIAARDTALRD